MAPFDLECHLQPAAILYLQLLASQSLLMLIVLEKNVIGGKCDVGEMVGRMWWWFEQSAVWWWFEQSAVWWGVAYSAVVAAVGVVD